MGRSVLGRCVRLTAAAVAGTVLLVSCANSGGTTDAANGGGSAQSGLVGNQDAGDPVRGGTLTFGTHSEAVTLDPAKTAARGGSGGAEMAAVYDVLMRYDTGTKTYAPQLAKSLQASDDQLLWTLKLREGVTFSDGTPLDAEAVRWSIDRYTQNRGNGSEVWQLNVAAVDTPDPSTVTFKLTRPWPEFEAMLALGQGMIVAKSSVQGDAFTPVGAGAFVQERYAPHEELVLKARPDYWNGAPYLDRLRVVALNGPQATWDALASGGVQAAFLRGDSGVIEKARAADYPGYVSFLNAGSAEIINNRAGRPGADVRVRQAIAYAANPKIVDERVDSGKGLPGAELFNDASDWHTDVQALGYDPAKAKQLLEEAKKDGYDGKLKYVVLQEPRDRAIGLAVQSLLQAVGFTVDIVYANSASDVVNQVYVKHDFDLAHAGIGLYESIPFLGLYTTMQSQSKSNTAGYADPVMDSLLGELQAAGTTDAKRAVIAKIQQQANETVPSVVTSAIPTFVAWQPKVHGIVPDATQITLFDKAWMQQP
ncbi:ABC transporter substrate-binding protein [Rhodococcus spelaei]|uniref:ABC transporter substrate-binding protein n=1 Tax=Rhodococcus spelaei TaxID=2546320 RepID=A0A541BA96_9NOCA|nr:ABC transporter substrate-binding protein [Rhodococcus spelaei]TQF69203.1 ABC transporter substrate-binding protein [Rhodococcus spelaei]